MEWLLTSVSNVTMANRRMHAPQHQGQHSIAKRAEAKRNSGSSSAAEAHQSTGEQIISRCAMLCVQSFVLNNVSSSLWRRAHSTAPLRTSAPSVHSPCAALCRCYPIRISLSQPQPIPAMPCHAMPCHRFHSFFSPFSSFPSSCALCGGLGARMSFIFSSGCPLISDATFAHPRCSRPLMSI